ncbi:hypothetical protein [Tateyamaria sp. syn59]|uniref:hypothetical protein n=1 Tax=Tateyamaria sp. syn59 TaxID=2576942 RepID=UPI0011BF9F5E|nr:hypothetical protein [Tateyamaria sp. syn59]
MSGEQKSRSAFVTMALSVLSGAALGGGLGVAVLPDFAAALAIGGAMMTGAIAVAWMLFQDG